MLILWNKAFKYKGLSVLKLLTKRGKNAIIISINKRNIKELIK